MGGGGEWKYKNKSIPNHTPPSQSQHIQIYTITHTHTHLRPKGYEAWDKLMTDDEWSMPLSGDEDVVFNSTSANVADHSSAGADSEGDDVAQDIFAGASNYE